MSRPNSFGRRRNTTSLTTCSVPARLDPQGTAVQHRWWPRRGHRSPPKCRPYPGEQLAQCEWLDDVVVRAKLEAGNPILLLASGGEHEHRHLHPLLADLLQHLKAVDTGKHHVEHNQIDMILMVQNELDRPLAIIR